MTDAVPSDVSISPTFPPARSGGGSVQARADALFRNSEILAPMVRASTTPLRTLALSYGADLVYTEEIVDRSITTCDRIANDALGTIDYVRKADTFSAKVRKRMKARGEQAVILRIVPEVERGRLIYQMGTGEVEFALPSALAVQRDVDGIDINMGCPKKFSLSGGMGSALLADTPRACNIIKTLRRNLDVPVSAKIRLLEDTRTTVDFVRALIGAGANAVTIHAREVGDESQKPAKWDRLVEVVQAVKACESVPIIINGDLFTRDDMVRMKERTGADGVMLARPALYNLSIFRKPRPRTNEGPEGGSDGSAAAAAVTAANSYSYDSPLLDSKTSVVQSYLRHAVKYATNPKNVKYVICEMMNNRRNPSNLVPNLPLDFPAGQTINAVCKTKSLDELCKLWDVNLSLADAIGAAAGGGSSAQPTGEHRYDDRYFLDPEALRKERERKQAARPEEEKKEGGGDGDGGGDDAPDRGDCRKDAARHPSWRDDTGPTGSVASKRQRVEE